MVVNFKYQPQYFNPRKSKYSGNLLWHCFITSALDINVKYYFEFLQNKLGCFCLTSTFAMPNVYRLGYGETPIVEATRTYQIQLKCFHGRNTLAYYCEANGQRKSFFHQNENLLRNVLNSCFSGFKIVSKFQWLTETVVRFREALLKGKDQYG